MSTRPAADATRWREHRLAGTLLRAVLGLAPTVVAGGTVLGFSLLVPDDAGLVTTVVLLVCILAAGFLAATLTANLSRRLLPLAALLKLSLVFPDAAPSRMRTALKSASVRRLKDEARMARAVGLSNDRTQAAEQILLLTTALGEHDRKTRGHSERVRVLSRLIGQEMGLDDDELDRLQWGALFHDIGKLTVAPEILNSPKPLVPTEWAIMHHHPEAGRELVAPLADFLGEHARTTDAHHEKWDGSGYPAGLAGADIPLSARIVAVADAFEVMTSVRAYKKPMSADAARSELVDCAGSHFDPDVVRALVSVSVGPLRWATGPVALAMTLPLVGKFFGVAAKLGFQLGGTPAAAAAAVPATATAASLSVAAATGVVGMPEPAPTAAVEQVDAETLVVRRIIIDDTTVDLDVASEGSHEVADATEPNGVGDLPPDGEHDSDGSPAGAPDLPDHVPPQAEGEDRGRSDEAPKGNDDNRGRSDEAPKGNDDNRGRSDEAQGRRVGRDSTDSLDD